MNLPDLETFWSLVAASRLVDPEDLRRLRAECHAGTVVDAAKWLVSRGALSTWQARRLARGDQGPFFIGPYRLMERIDADGQGLLFRVRDDASGRRLQLRLLDRPSCKRQDVWTGIVRRTTIAHAARHPLLSKTMALEKADSHRFILCEDVPLATLTAELSGQGGMSAEDAARIALQVARAVAELHRLGDVHGAISPDAIRREPSQAGGEPSTGRVRLAQFPLAGDPHLQPPRLPVDSVEAMQRLGQRVCFAAPELATGSPCDPRADVYAIGRVVQALVSGEAPGWQGDPRRTLDHATAADLPTVVLPDGLNGLANVIATMTARDPRARYPSAVEAADALAVCLGMPPESIVPPPLARPTAGNDSAVLAAAPASASLSVAPPLAQATAAFPSIDAALPARSRPRGGRGAGPRGRRGTNRVALWTTAGLLAVSVVGIAGLVVMLGKGTGRPSAEPAPTAVANTVASERAAPAARDGDRPRSTEKGAETTTAPSSRPLVDDDRLPWGSPTAGDPPTLAYLPPGSQLVLLVRPAEIAADEEGSLFLRSLGPQVAAALEAVTRLCGCGLDGVDTIQAGWQAGGPGEVLGGYTLWLREPVDEPAVAARIDGATASAVGGEKIHVGKGSSLWLPSAEGRRVLVCGDEKLVRATLGAESQAGAAADGKGLRAVLPRDMEVLVGMLDQSRHVTLLGAPHYLRTEGRHMLVGPLARIVDPLGDFLDEAVRAAALSLHFGESLYVELDAVESVDRRAPALAKSILQRLGSLADVVEDWSAGQMGVQYGRKLVNRLPAMVRVLAANARSGAEGKGAVVNAYLPRHAGHNLALATELALAQADAVGPAVAVTAAKPAAGAGGVRERLAKKTSLSFPRDTLERSIQVLGEDIGVSIEILGNDLKLEGITKNQSFALDEKNKPAEEILRAILIKANPDGKLVYVIRGAGDGESLVVTTRAAAAERREPLPPALQAPAADSKTK